MNDEYARATTRDYTVHLRHIAEEVRMIEVRIGDSGEDRRALRALVEECERIDVHLYAVIIYEDDGSTTVQGVVGADDLARAERISTVVDEALRADSGVGGVS